ncbi:terminase family protein [bacterium]|nr:terminase family protein [bacterium]
MATTQTSRRDAIRAARKSRSEGWDPDFLRRLSQRDFFKVLGYTPHRGQRRIHQCTRRFTVAICGRRWGKTLAAAREAGHAALQPGARIYVVAPYQHLCARVFDRLWRDLVTRMKLPTTARSRSEMYLEFPWNARIEGRTAERPDNLVGEGLSYVVFDEAAKARSGVWERYIAPSLMDRRGRALFISTPEGMNWLYDLYLRGRRKTDRDWHSFISPSSNNPYLPAEELKLARRTLSRFAYAQEINAEFTRAANLVYAAFSHEKHVKRLSYDPQLPLYRAMDFGYTNPFVCLTIQVAPGDEVRVLDEMYLRAKTIGELAELMKQTLSPYYGQFRKFWCSQAVRRPRGHHEAPLTHPLTGAPRFPRNVDEFNECTVHFCDPSGAGERAHLRTMGVFTQARSSPLALGIELIRSALEGDGENPRLFIDPRCTNLLREFSSYRYPDEDAMRAGAAQSRETPLKESDHALDALRYFMVNQF